MPATEPPLVLLADDHKDSREMYGGYLRSKGFRVAEARDGAEAVKLAKEKQPAVIVMDLHMPRIDGLAATRLIRRDKKIRDIRILVLTAYDVDEQDALNAGATAVCVKPCMPDNLVTLIQKLIKREHSL